MKSGVTCVLETRDGFTRNDVYPSFKYRIIIPQLSAPCGFVSEGDLNTPIDVKYREFEVCEVFKDRDGNVTYARYKEVT